MLTDLQKKYLTEEVLHEPWHELDFNCYVLFIGYPQYRCACGKYHATISNRTFTTWQDLGDVVRALDRDKVTQTLMRVSYCSDDDMPTFTLLATAMQQPDFVEKFCEEVARMGGITE